MTAARRTDAFPSTWGEDVIYCDATCDPEDTFYIEPETESSQNASERRKTYADAGRRFLEGHTPFLLSATLKGPFDRASGWKNPWAKTHDSVYDIPNDDSFVSSQTQPKKFRKIAAGKRKAKVTRQVEEQYLPSPESLKQEPVTEHPFLDDDELKLVQSWRESIVYSPIAPSRRWSKTGSSAWLKTTSRKRKFEDEPAQRQTLGASQRHFNNDNINSNIPSVPRLKTYNSAPAQLDNGAGFYRSPTHSSTKAPPNNSQPSRRPTSRHSTRPQSIRPASESEDELSQECSEGVIMTTPVSMKNTAAPTYTPKSSPLKKQVLADISEPEQSTAEQSDHGSIAPSSHIESLADVENDYDMEDGGALIDVANHQEPTEFIDETFVQDNETAFEIQEELVAMDDAIDATDSQVVVPQAAEHNTDCVASEAEESSEISFNKELEEVENETVEDATLELPLYDELPMPLDDISITSSDDAESQAEQLDAVHQEPQEEFQLGTQEEEIQEENLVEETQADVQTEEAHAEAAQVEKVEAEEVQQAETQEQEPLQSSDEEEQDVQQPGAQVETQELASVEAQPPSASESNVILEEPAETAQSPTPAIAEVVSPAETAQEVLAVLPEQPSADVRRERQPTTESVPQEESRVLAESVVDGQSVCGIQDSVPEPIIEEDTQDTEMMDADDAPVTPGLSAVVSPGQSCTSEFSFRSVFQRLVPANTWSTLSMVAAQALATSRQDEHDQRESAVQEPTSLETCTAQVEDGGNSSDEHKENITTNLETLTSEDLPTTSINDAEDVKEVSITEPTFHGDVDISLVKEEPSTEVLPSIEVPQEDETEITEITTGATEEAPCTVTAESPDVPEQTDCDPVTNDELRGPTPEPQFNFTSFASFASPLKMRKAAKAQMKTGRKGASGILRQPMGIVSGGQYAKKNVTWATELEQVKESDDSPTRSARGHSPPPSTALGDLPMSLNDKFRNHFSAVVSRTDGLQHKFRNYSKSQRKTRSMEAKDSSIYDVPMSDEPTSQDDVGKVGKEVAQLQQAEEPMDIVQDLFAEMGDFLQAFDVDNELDQARDGLVV